MPSPGILLAVLLGAGPGLAASPPGPRTAAATAERFLAELLSGDAERAAPFFDVESAVIGAAPPQALIQMTAVEPDALAPLNKLLAAPERVRTQRAALERIRLRLARAKCTVGAVARHVESKRRGQVGPVRNTIATWLASIESIEFVALKCLAPSFMAPENSDLQFEYFIQGLIVVQRSGRERAVAAVGFDQPAGFEAVAELLGHDPEAEALQAAAAALRDKQERTRDALATILAGNTFVSAPKPRRAFRWWGAAGDFRGDGGMDFVETARDRTMLLVKVGTAPPQPIGLEDRAALQTVLNAGDLDGDGRDDLAFTFIGASRSWVLVWPSGSTANAYRVLSPPGASRFFGLRSAGGGDFNGDGYADLAVADSGSAVYVFFGSPTGLSRAPAVRIDGPARSDFGHALEVLGDLDGDGRDDLGVDATTYDNHTGRLFVFFGTNEGVEVQPSVVLTGAAMGNRFGEGITGGDVDGDGQLELIVASPGALDRRGLIEVFRREKGSRRFGPSPSISLRGDDQTRYRSLGSSMTFVTNFDPQKPGALVVSIGGSQNGGPAIVLYTGKELAERSTIAAPMRAEYTLSAVGSVSDQHGAEVVFNTNGGPSAVLRTATRRLESRLASDAGIGR